MTLGAGSAQHSCRANFYDDHDFQILVCFTNLFPVNVRHTPVCNTVYFCFVILHAESSIYKPGVSIKLQRHGDGARNARNYFLIPNNGQQMFTLKSCFTP